MNNLFIRIFIASVISILSLQCICPTIVPAGQRIKVQLKWYHQFQFAGYYAALEKGFYAEEGLEVELIERNQSINVIETVESGKADLGIESADLIVARSNGHKVQVIASVFQYTPLILLTTESNHIQTLSDLAGKDVMLDIKSDMGIISMLENQGVRIEHINIIPQSYNIDDLISGKVQALSAYSTNEPYLLQSRGINPVVFPVYSYGVDLYGDCIFTSDEYAKYFPDEISAFLRATQKGWQYAFRNTEEVVDLIINKYKTEKSHDALHYEADEMRKLILPEIIEIGHMEKRRWKRIIDTYIHHGYIKGDIDIDHFIFSPPERINKLAKQIIAGILIAMMLLFLLSMLYRKRLTTEIKDKTRHLKESEEKFKRIFDMSIDPGILVSAQDSTIVQVNNSFLNITGLALSDVIGKTALELNLYTDPGDRNQIMNELKTYGKVANKEISLNVREGIIEVLFSSSIIEIEGASYILSFVRDITEKKKYERRLKEQHRLLLQIAQNYPNSYLSLIEKDMTIGFTSGKAFEKLGLDPQSFIGMRLQDVFGDQYAYVQSQYARTFNGETVAFEMFFNNQHQKYSATPLRDEQNSISRILVVVEEISERVVFDNFKNLLIELTGNLMGEEAAHIDKWINNVLKMIGEYFSSDRSYVFMLDQDSTSTLMTNTHEWCREGIEPQIDKLSNIPIDSLPWVMGKIRALEVVSIAAVDNLPQDAHAEKEHFEAQNIKSLLVAPLIYRENVVGFLGLDFVTTQRFSTGKDEQILSLTSRLVISAIKHMEANKLLYEYEKIVTSTSDRLSFIDRKYTYQAANESFCRFFHKKKEEIIGHHVSEIIGEERFQQFVGMFNRALDGEVISFETSREKADGGMAHFSIEYSPYHLPDGSIEGVTVIAHDITERKEFENKLKITNIENQAMLKASRGILQNKPFKETARHIFDTCKELIGATAGYVALLSKTGEENEVLFLDAGGRKCTVDPSLPMPIRGLRAESYKLSKTVYDNDFMNSKWIDFMPGGHVTLDNVMFAPLPIEGTVAGIMGLANKEGGFDSEDVRIATAFGELAAVALKNSRDYDGMAEALNIKDNLIREINHRIKNNFAVLQSLIELQGGKLEGEEAISSFEEVKGRVQSMTMIHERLYADENQREVDFRDYVTGLARSLKISFGTSDQIIRIYTEQIPSIKFDVQVMIPCGLILNELITNAFKYAFKGKPEGMIEISLEAQGKDGYLLTVRDDGVGLPEMFDLHRTHSLGMKIISVLSKQLFGRFEILSNNGTVARLYFKTSSGI